MPSSKKDSSVTKHGRLDEKAASGKEADNTSVSLILKKRSDKSNEFFVVQDASLDTTSKNHKPGVGADKRSRRSLRGRSENVNYKENAISSGEESELSKENEVLGNSPRRRSQKITDAVLPKRSRRKQTLQQRLSYNEDLEQCSSSDSDIFPEPNKCSSLTNANESRTPSPSKRRRLEAREFIEKLLDEETDDSSDGSECIPAIKLEFFPEASPRSSPRVRNWESSPRARKPSGFYVDIIPETELVPNETETKPTKIELKNPSSPSVGWRLKEEHQTPVANSPTSDNSDSNYSCERSLKIRLIKCDSLSPVGKIGTNFAATPESPLLKTRSRPASNLSMIAEGDDAVTEDDESRTPTRRAGKSHRSGRAASPIATTKIRSQPGTPERTHLSLHRAAMENSPRASLRERKERKDFQEFVLSPVTTRSGRSTPQKETLSTPEPKSQPRKNEKSQPSSPMKTGSRSTTPMNTNDQARTSIIKSKDRSLQRTAKGKQATPSSNSGTPMRAGLKSGPCTPSMPQRAGAVTTPSTPMEEARAKLHVSAVPKELLCRELMFEKVRQFLAARLEDCSGGAMYISGVPGTGKTATVRKVVDALHEEYEFQYIEVNGMCMTTPYQLYTQIFEALTGCRLPWAQALTKLEKHFTGKKTRSAVVIVVDELDLICNTRQDVVYNLLDWPRRAPVVVITIANTMDLPERLLHGKVASRLGLTRAVFKPYTSSELEQIVTSRLLGTNAFDKDAVRFVAKKVASISGDCRRALDICRRATEVAESCAGGIVTMEHVQSAIDEMMLSFKVKAIKGLSRLEQAFLRSVANSVDAGTEETSFFKVYRDLLPLCTLEGLHAPTVSAAQSACARLSQVRLVISAKNGVHAKILLNCDPDDIHYALAVK